MVLTVPTPEPESSKTTPTTTSTTSSPSTSSSSTGSEAQSATRPPPLFGFLPSKTLLNSERHKKDFKERDLDYFRILVGPATGPRLWSTFGFDVAFLDHLKKESIYPREEEAKEELRERWLVGGSTGAFRFTAILHELALHDLYGVDRYPSEPSSILQRYSDVYIGMTFFPGDTTDKLEGLMNLLMDSILPTPQIPKPPGPESAEEAREKGYAEIEIDIDAVYRRILNHPTLHLAFFVTQLPDYHQKLPRAVSALMTVAGGVLGRIETNPNGSSKKPEKETKVEDTARLKCKRVPGMKRLCFYTGPSPPPFLSSRDYIFSPLTRDNLRHVLLATSSVPYVRHPCFHIPGYGSGYFVDGGVTDYVLNFANKFPEYPALVLHDIPEVHPTYLDSVVPKWFGNGPISIPAIPSSVTNFVSNLVQPAVPIIKRNLPSWIVQPLTGGPDETSASASAPALSTSTSSTTSTSTAAEEGNGNEEEEEEVEILQNCSLVHPTIEFLHKIGHDSLPSFGDWFYPAYLHRPQQRILFWKAVRDGSIQHWPTRLSSVVDLPFSSDIASTPKPTASSRLTTTDVAAVSIR